MSKFKDRLGGGTIGIVIAVLALVAGAIWWFGIREAPLGQDDVLAVDDVILTADEYEERSAALTAINGLQVPSDDGARQVFERQMAKSIAISLVLEEEADERDIEVSDADADAALGKLLDQVGGDRDKLQAYLDRFGVDVDVVREELRQSLAARALYDEVTADLPEVDDDELRKAFDSASGHLGTPEKRTVSSIVVKTEPEAKQVLTRLRDGADFAALAAELSLDEQTANKGGVLGTFERDDLEEEYAELAFSAKVGELFGPVKTWSGWHVARVDAVQKGAAADFEKSKESLRAQVTEQRAVEKWESWLKDALEEAEVRYSDRYRPAAPLDPRGAVPSL